MNLRKLFWENDLSDPDAGSDADTVYLWAARFRRVDDRCVVAAFDGGAVTSDAGVLLLRETDRATG